MENVKRERLEVAAVDRINMLPTEVLGLIFSFLTLKEAAAKALVCPPWKHLWTLTPTLDFDARNPTHKQSPSSSMVESSTFVHHVDAVITSLSQQNPNSILQGFRVFSDLGSAHAESIDQWLSYALTNNLQTLDLTFFNYHALKTVYNRQLCYDFPYKGMSKCKHLKQLTLHSVNVTGEALEFVVSNSPLLEGLSVSESQVLSSLEIIRPSPSFKCLEICLCLGLKTVVVRESDIATIKYCGTAGAKFVLSDVPLLTHLWLHNYGTRSVDDVAKMFACVFKQIQFLKVYFTSPKGNTNMSNEMCNIKQLVVSLPYDYEEKDSLLPLVKLISAFPLLERFVLEQAHEDVYVRDAVAAAVAAERVHFHHLKEVELVGYRGVATQLELIMYFVDNATALQSVIVDPSRFYLGMVRPWRRLPLHEFDDDEMLARAHAEEQLKHILPQKIGLKIL